MAHKHAELIHAWADGAEIQCSIPGKGWVNVSNPMWALDDIYRVKPKIRSIKGKYRVALYKSGNHFWAETVNTVNHFWTETNNIEITQKIKEEGKFFFDWLTDWVEYDVAIEE